MEKYEIALKNTINLPKPQWQGLTQCAFIFRVCLSMPNIHRESLQWRGALL
jgi:hypothetical protein